MIRIFKMHRIAWLASAILGIGMVLTAVSAAEPSRAFSPRVTELGIKEYECHYKCAKCGYSVTTKRMLSPDERKCPICGGLLFFRGTSG